MKYDIVIFDFDGTIAESGPGIMGSSRYALRKMGWEVPSDDVLRKFVGPPLYENFRNLCGMNHEQAEQAIADTEEKISELEARMADPDTYKDPAAAQNLAKEHREAQDALEKLYEDWEELSEAVAELP